LIEFLGIATNNPGKPFSSSTYVAGGERLKNSFDMLLKISRRDCLIDDNDVEDIAGYWTNQQADGMNDKISG
jgi:hypothetical protein